MSENHDPWLYSGCPCWCWNDPAPGFDISKRLRCFMNYDSENNPIFSDDTFVSSHGKYTNSYDHYKPIGTPWDFAPELAAFIIIDKHGSCYFVDKARSEIKTEKWNDQKYITSITFVWLNCPDHLKDHIWPRPEWAKNEHQYSAAFKQYMENPDLL